MGIGYARPLRSQIATQEMLEIIVTEIGLRLIVWISAVTDHKTR